RLSKDRPGHDHTRRHQSVDSRSTKNLWRRGGSSLRSTSARCSKHEGIAMINPLPGWAEQMGDLFRSGSVAQFLIHGNIFDVVGIEDSGGRRLLSLKAFLKDVMFESYDVVLEYDRGRGIRLTKGAEDWAEWLK